MRNTWLVPSLQKRDIRWLKSKGITTIINLRLPGEHEKHIVENLGMTYIHIPWADERAPSIEQTRQRLESVRNSQRRVFQHCLRGIGRDIAMAGCYKIATHGELASKFIEEGRRSAPHWESDQKRD